jgi:hypothetical protein
MPMVGLLAMFAHLVVTFLWQFGFLGLEIDRPSLFYKVDQVNIIVLKPKITQFVHLHWSMPGGSSTVVIDVVGSAKVINTSLPTERTEMRKKRKKKFGWAKTFTHSYELTLQARVPRLTMCEKLFEQYSWYER